MLDADIWGFSVPRLLGISDRMEAAQVDGVDKPLIIPNERVVGDGLLKVVSTGFLVERGDRPDVARPDAHQGGRAVPRATCAGATSTTC